VHQGGEEEEEWPEVCLPSYHTYLPISPGIHYIGCSVSLRCSL